MPYKDSYIWKIRQKIDHDVLLAPSADAIAVRDDGKLLLIFNKDWQNWFFPGGYAEIGQTSQECAARELLEEGGIQADPSSMIPIGFVSGHTAKYKNGDITYPFTQVFMTKVWEESVELHDETEVGDRRWLSIEELKQMSPNSYTSYLLTAYEIFLATNEYQLIDVR